LVLLVPDCVIFCYDWSIVSKQLIKIGWVPKIAAGSDSLVGWSCTWWLDLVWFCAGKKTGSSTLTRCKAVARRRPDWMIFSWDSWPDIELYYIYIWLPATDCNGNIMHIIMGGRIKNTWGPRFPVKKKGLTMFSFLGWKSNVTVGIKKLPCRVINNLVTAHVLRLFGWQSYVRRTLRQCNFANGKNSRYRLQMLNLWTFWESSRNFPVSLVWESQWNMINCQELFATKTLWMTLLFIALVCLPTFTSEINQIY
jgi:hypothetical protein